MLGIISGSLNIKVNIATKLPHYMIKTRENAEKFFQEELKRLKKEAYELVGNSQT